MSEPFAFFITFRCYGTWLHGDERGSVDAVHRAPGSPPVATNPLREAFARERLRRPPFELDTARREVVEASLSEVCVHRGWTFIAANVRTNHVHVVVAGETTLERMMTAFKAWSTRRLREATLAGEGSPWSRHGSTRYLWNEEQVSDAVAYVVDGQGELLR